jgi:hypothetical protein
MTLYYQINYTLTDVPEDAAYFHAQFRRVNPLPYKDRLHDPRRRARAGPLRRHLHGLGRQQQRLVGRGRDQVLHGRRQASSRPSAAPAPRTTSAARTTSRTARRRQYQESPRPTPAAAGDPPDGVQAQQRFGLYRWHIMDPIRFEQDLRVTIQALGWRNGGATCRCRTTSPRSPTGTRPPQQARRGQAVQEGE